jgi:hypothetical protein
VRTVRVWSLAFGVSLSAVAFNCSEHVEIAHDLAAATAGAVGISGAANGAGGSSIDTGGSAEAGAAASGGAAHVCMPTPCQGQIYQCGDCKDNDGDGLIDSDDPDCTGPCDNTEDSYFGGIPGQNNAPCRQDCYFDQDTGSGNDQCYWSQDCDPLSVAPDYPPSGDSHCAYNPNANIPGSGSTCDGLATMQASACLNYCLPLTPNGCDCFGCCELPADSGNYVWIGSATQNTGTCDAAHVSDPTACHPCTPVKSCFKACDPCAVCVGRTTPSPSCQTPGVGRCTGNAAPCGQPGEAACPTDYYCVTGCCEAAPR